jgi:glycosidase
MKRKESFCNMAKTTRSGSALPRIFPALAVFLLALSCRMPPAEPLLSLSALGQRNEGTWYQIFSYSFADSNGDGIGDLNGIAQRLDYLNDTNTAGHRARLAAGEKCNESLHIDGIWLTPIMPSPSYHKYDTKDYMDIDPAFGTLADFQNLVRKCHERGIKIIIDLVMNHSSEQHPWFQKALEEVRSGHPGRYAAYYNFYYGATPPENYKFKWDEYGNSYYKWWGRAAENAWFEGSFWTGMPDLNWDSQALREEFEKVVRFWLEAGLDGFRLDATSWPYNYRGMERVNEGVNGEEKNIELWTWFAAACKKVNPGVFLVGECWEGEDTIANYYRSKMNYFGFQFSTQNGGGGSIRWGAQGHGHDYVNAVYYWDRKIRIRYPDAISVPFLSNHDQDRSAHFLMEDERKMAAALMLLTPGAPFIYYGEEIGLTSGAGFEYPDSNRRGPMIWSWPNNSGAPSPPSEWNWSKLAPENGQGVAQQLQDENSLLRYYIRVGNLKRKYPWLAWGIVESLNANTDPAVAAYRLTNPDDGRSIIVAHNTDYSVKKNINAILSNAKVLEGFAVSGWSSNGEQSCTGAFDLPPYSTVIFREY